MTASTQEFVSRFDRALAHDDLDALAMALDERGRMLRERGAGLTRKELSALEAAGRRAQERLRALRGAAERQIAALRSARDRAEAFRPTRRQRPARVDIRL